MVLEKERVIEPLTTSRLPRQKFQGLVGPAGQDMSNWDWARLDDILEEIYRHLMLQGWRGSAVDPCPVLESFSSSLLAIFPMPIIQFQSRGANSKFLVEGRDRLDYEKPDTLWPIGWVAPAFALISHGIIRLELHGEEGRFGKHWNGTIRSEHTMRALIGR